MCMGCYVCTRILNIRKLALPVRVWMSFLFKPLCSSQALNEEKLSGELLRGFAGGLRPGPVPVCVCVCVCDYV